MRMARFADPLYCCIVILSKFSSECHKFLKTQAQASRLPVTRDTACHLTVAYVVAGFKPQMQCQVGEELLSSYSLHTLFIRVVSLFQTVVSFSISYNR